MAVFRAVNGLPDGQAPFWVFLSNATKTTGGLVLLGVLFVTLVAIQKTRKAAVLSMLAWPLANLVTDVLKDAWKWPRPSWPSVVASHPDFTVRVEPLTSYGTASAHSANMMAIAVCFLWLYRPLGWAWLVVALLTGVSRIYVGVHWPSQVLLGWLCGAVAATVLVKSVEAWVRLRQARSQTPQNSHPEAP